MRSRQRGTRSGDAPPPPRHGFEQTPTRAAAPRPRSGGSAPPGTAARTRGAPAAGRRRLPPRRTVHRRPAAWRWRWRAPPRDEHPFPPPRRGGAHNDSQPSLAAGRGAPAEAQFAPFVRASAHRHGDRGGAADTGSLLDGSGRGRAGGRAGAGGGDGGWVGVRGGQTLVQRGRCRRARRRRCRHAQQQRALGDGASTPPRPATQSEAMACADGGPTLVESRAALSAARACARFSAAQIFSLGGKITPLAAPPRCAGRAPTTHRGGPRWPTNSSAWRAWGVAAPVAVCCPRHPTGVGPHPGSPVAHEDPMGRAKGGAHPCTAPRLVNPTLARCRCKPPWGLATRPRVSRNDAHHTPPRRRVDTTARRSAPVPRRDGAARRDGIPTRAGRLFIAVSPSPTADVAAHPPTAAPRDGRPASPS